MRLVATRGSIDRINKEKGLQTMGSGRKIMFNPDRSLDSYAPFRPVHARESLFSTQSHVLFSRVLNKFSMRSTLVASAGLKSNMLEKSLRAIQS